MTNGVAGKAADGYIRCGRRLAAATEGAREAVSGHINKWNPNDIMGPRL